MKKGNPLHLLPGIAVGLLLMCGCGSSSYGLSPKNPTSVSVWHYYNGAQAAAFDELVSQFNATVGTEKGIIVDSVSKSSIDDLTNAVTASAKKEPGAENLPNMFQCYLDTAVSLDSLEILADLDPYISEEEKASYVDSYIEEGIFGESESLKLFPIAKSTELLILNETAFEPFSDAAGITEDDLSTWEGIAAAAEAYYTYSGGKSFFGRDSFANYMLIGSMQLGQEIFETENGSVTVHLDHDIMRKLWDNYYIPYVSGYYRHMGRFRTDDLKTGTLIAAVGSSTSITYLPDETTDETGSTAPAEYKALPVPNFEGTNGYAVQQGASMAVTKSSEKEEYASVTFLKWLTENQNNIHLSISSGYLPVRKEANNMKQIDSYLAQQKISLTDFEYQSLETAISQIGSDTLYTSTGFENEYAARTILNTSMIDLAISDQEAAEAAMAAGSSREEALAPYLTDGHFEAWYQDITLKLNETCTE